MAQPSFERSVFINCPFDEDYEPILQAILFCVVYLGLHPRIARERNDSAEVRIEKITGLIEAPSSPFMILAGRRPAKRASTTD